MKLKIAFLICSFLLSIIVFAQANEQPNSNRRMVRQTYAGRAFREEYNYVYDAQLRIKKITHTQDGKLSSTTESFTYNNLNQLTSYIKTYAIDISPEKTTVEYDDKNTLKRIEINRTQNTKKQNFVSSWDYAWENDSILSVTDTRFVMGKTQQQFRYTFNKEGNIIKKEGLGQAASASNTLYSNFDKYYNPNLFLGGFTDQHIISRNNCGTTNYVGNYIINSSFEYYSKTVTTYKPGGAKIPTQKMNTGFISKETQTSFDKDAKKVFVVGTTTYTYINL
jgi:hypothetical protein